MDEDESLSVPLPGVLANDSDPNDDDLTAVLVSAPTTAQAFDLDDDGSFDYTPPQDFNGTTSFTYRASDGQATSGVATVTLTVNPVNDAPAFSAGGDVTSALADAILGFTEDQWATGIDPGPPDEAAQDVEFQVTLNDPADADAFLVLPEVSDDGTLTFQANPLLTLLDPRTIPLTVVLQDSGGGASAPQEFSVTLTP